MIHTHTLTDIHNHARAHTTYHLQALIADIIRTSDQDRDGRICFDEFIPWCAILLKRAWDRRDVWLLEGEGGALRCFM